MIPCPAPACPPGELARMIAATAVLNGASTIDEMNDHTGPFDDEINNRPHRLEACLHELARYRRLWWRSPAAMPIAWAIAGGYCLGVCCALLVHL